MNTYSDDGVPHVALWWCCDNPLHWCWSGRLHSDNTTFSTSITQFISSNVLLSIVIFFCNFWASTRQPMLRGRVSIGSKIWYPDPDPSIPGRKTRPGSHTRVIHYQPESDHGNDTNGGMLLFILFSWTNILTACAIDEVSPSEDERKAEAFFKKGYSSHHIIHTPVCKS